jgi:hypothetical protein
MCVIVLNYKGVINHHMLTDVQKNKIAHLFNVLDTNKNGQLQLDDFVEVSDQIIIHLKWDRESRVSQVLLKKASRLFIQLLIDSTNLKCPFRFETGCCFLKRK